MKDAKTKTVYIVSCLQDFAQLLFRVKLLLKTNQNSVHALHFLKCSTLLGYL